MPTGTRRSRRNSFRPPAPSSGVARCTPGYSVPGRTPKFGSADAGQIHRERRRCFPRSAAQYGESRKLQCALPAHLTERAWHERHSAQCSLRGFPPAPQQPPQLRRHRHVVNNQRPRASNNPIPRITSNSFSTFIATILPHPIPSRVPVEAAFYPSEAEGLRRALSVKLQGPPLEAALPFPGHLSE